MLPFRAGPPALRRASSHLTRRITAQLLQTDYLKRRWSSTSAFIQSVSRTGRHSNDAEEREDARSHPEKAAFSHFFDKSTPPSAASTAPPSTKPKASHEIVSASRDAVSAFRHAIGTRVPAKIIETYELLVQAQQRHAQDVRDSSSQAVERSDVGFPVRKADIQTAVRCLIQHAQREAQMSSRLVATCQQMFRDMSQRFGYRISPTDLHRQLQTYCLSKSPSPDPCEAFEQLRASYPEWETNSADWNLVISYLVQRRSYGHAIKLYGEMLDIGVEPWAQLRNTMIRAYLAVSNVAEADAQLQRLEQKEGQLGIDSLTTTVEGLCKLVSTTKEVDPELMSKLRKYASDLRKVVDSHPQAASDSSAWQTLLRYEAILAGPAHALQTARRASRSGLFGYSTLCMLLRLHVDELNDLQTSDEALDLLDKVQSAIDPKRTLLPDDRCYNILMLGLLNPSSSDDAAYIDGAALFPDEDGDGAEQRFPPALPSPNQVREAQLLYDHVRSLGVPPTPLLVTPLLTAYCEAFLPSLSSAMELVQDMLDHQASSSAPAGKSASSTRRKASRARSSAISMSIICPVLDACVKLKDLRCARDLLSRLHEAGIAMDPAHKSQLMQQLIGITTSWPEAFHIYRSLSRFPTSSSAGTRGPGRGLDERGYIALLESFRSLTFRDPKAPSSSSVQPAPPEELLGIVQDMRAAGHRPSCAIYTSILDYYAKTPQPSYSGVQATHEMLKEDQGLEPDLPLINALMNAYNRADEPAMALAIWDSLLATRQEIDGVTLSVFFDMAGRHGLLSLARKAIRTVRRMEAEGGGGAKSAMSKGAWDSWLECLARCGRLEEAIELAFGEMRTTLFREAIDAHDVQEEGTVTVAELVVRSTQAPVKDRFGQVVGPDAKTLGTLLRFAARERDRRQKRFMCLPGPTSGGTSIWHTLRTRIRDELCWLYPQVKQIGENAPI